MSDLVSNIEILLENHDFVTVPGFGGFVAEAEGASEAADMLYPPRKALAFNPALTYNDGLLAHEYVKKAGVSFEKANLMIAEAVNELNRKLISGMPVIFGTLGTFRISNGNILFTMSGKGGFLSSSYGLDEVYFPAIAGANVAATPGQVRTNAAMPAAPAIRPSAAPLRRAELIQSNDLIRNEWGLSKALGMAAAILLLIMLFPVRIQDGNFANYASIMPAAIHATIQSDPDCPQFHMIIASFNTKYRAEKFISALPGELKDRSRIIYSEKRFRIALESFASEEAGEAYIAQFIKEFPEYYDAWILNYNP